MTSFTDDDGRARARARADGLVPANNLHHDERDGCHSPGIYAGDRLGRKSEGAEGGTSARRN